jgi:CRP-like cAMP-binding protein
MSVFNKYLDLDGIAELRQFFIEKGTTHDCQKNEFFMQQGQTQNYVGFILKGGFRYVRYTSEGTEQIVGYSFENDFVVDYGAFQVREPAFIGGQAIKHSTVLRITYDELNDFYDQCYSPNLRGRVSETFFEDIYGRLLSLYCDSPEKRYIRLIERYPEILKQVRLKEIASLIKTTPETLSRIRRKLSLQPNP